ncbi:MAG: hypothetical protein GY795_46220 [Desulfobacterales bacterium]|nr:hypothetical protein [Desulfobacterales bacterium]
MGESSRRSSLGPRGNIINDPAGGSGPTSDPYSNPDYSFDLRGTSAGGDSPPASDPYSNPDYSFDLRETSAGGGDSTSTSDYYIQITGGDRTIPKSVYGNEFDIDFGEGRIKKLSANAVKKGFFYNSDGKKIIIKNGSAIYEVSGRKYYEHGKVLPGDGFYDYKPATTLQKIKEMRSEGMSNQKIAEFLNSQSIPTISGSGKWHRNSVNRMLGKIGKKGK